VVIGNGGGALTGAGDGGEVVIGDGGGALTGAGDGAVVEARDTSTASFWL
jgi:hypothetical protein